MRHLWPAMVAVMIITLMQSAAAQVPTFKVTAKEVRIDVLVADHGKPVTGLQAVDFEVLDNGVRQEVGFSGFERMPISATMVLDMSRSVAGELLDRLKGAGDVLLKGLKKDERAALITFSHAVKLGSPFTTDHERVKTALDSAQPFGDTSVIDASYAGLILAESAFDRPLLIVFSDGLDTLSWLSSKEVLESAKQTDAVVYAVSTGRLPDNPFLRDLTKFTGGSLFEDESTENLSHVFVSILEEFRRRYLLTYIPRSVSTSGWHTIKVRVKGSHDKVIYRPGYMSDPSSTK